MRNDLKVVLLILVSIVAVLLIGSLLMRMVGLDSLHDLGPCIGCDN